MCTAHWGQLGYLTPSQEDVLTKFRKDADPSYIQAAKYTVETHDQCCLRFLRARQFDTRKALILLQECHQKLTDMKASYWAQCGPDECANCDIAALKNFYPHTQKGYDKQNRPIFFEHTGGIKPNAILNMLNRKGLINYHWWNMETTLDKQFTEAAKRDFQHLEEKKRGLETIKEGKDGEKQISVERGREETKTGGDIKDEADMPTEGEQEKGEERDKDYQEDYEKDHGKENEVLHNISTFVILDLKNLNHTHCSQRMLDQMKLYIGLDNTCYPEILGKMLVINAPFIAVQTWGIVRRWLDPRTQNKIELVGPSNSLACLHELISKDQLASQYGGTAPDIYHRKDNTEWVQVPRAGSIVRSIEVPIGKGLKIDSYVSEGPVDITVSSLASLIGQSADANTTPDTTSATTAATPSKKKASPHFQSLQPHVLCPPVTVKPSDNREDGPARHVQHMPPSESVKTITVTWSNKSNYSSRPLIYVLTITDE